MNCCSCAPLAVETIYNKVEELEKKGLISSQHLRDDAQQAVGVLIGATLRSRLALR